MSIFLFYLLFIFFYVGKYDGIHSVGLNFSYLTYK